jgi:hypothetical protein
MTTFSADLRRSLDSADRREGRPELDLDHEAEEGAAALFSAQETLARMRADDAFATAVRTLLSGKKRAAAEAEREARKASASFAGDLSSEMES